MQNNYLHITVLLFLTIIFSKSFSQNQDFETWTGITIKKRISSKTELKLREEIRLSENSLQINNVFTDFGVLYKISESFNAGIYYRYIRKSNYPNFINQHKIYGDIEYNKPINNFILKYRLRFQTKYSEIYSCDYGLIPANTLRNKISISYKIKDKPIVPKVSADAFLPVNYINYAFYKIRTSIGFKYKINKYNSVNLSFIIDKELNTTNPLTSNILALNYKFRL